MPDPIVLLPDPDEERDFLFDVRTMYFVLDKEVGHFDDHPYGEGNPEIFAIIRTKPSEIEDQYEYAQVVDQETGIGTETRRRIRKLDLAHFNANCTPANRINSGLLPNVYKFKARFVAGNEEDFRAEIAKYDTRQNAVRTVGDGYTFATIQASINAGSSGDVSAVYGNATNSYNENITDNGLDDYQLVGMAESTDGVLPGIRIHSGAGIVIDINVNLGWHIENFELDGEGTAGTGLYVRTGSVSAWVSRCVVHGVTGNGMYVISRWSVVVNCGAYDCNNGFYVGTSTREARSVHCTSVDNITAGFTSNVAGIGKCVACLASDNGTDYVNCGGGGGWNVSSDATAPGSGSRLNFTNANFVNYGANDFRLSYPQVGNGANVDGWPLLCEDYLTNVRERDTLVFYAGFHDPYVPPVGGAPTCLGVIDAAPAAQGCILVRFFEMVFAEGTVPYRYDIHVKQLDDGVLTPGEIDNQSYYSRSVYQEDIAGHPDASVSPPIGPAVVSALIAFEAYSQHADNIHLMTNRQYQVAVRAVAIDAADTIYEDDNDEVVISYSSGYQGIQWTHILSWPCLELCEDQEIGISGIPPLSVGVTATPPVEFADSAVLDINILDWPQLDAHTHRNRGG